MKKKIINKVKRNLKFHGINTMKQSINYLKDNFFTFGFDYSRHRSHRISDPKIILKGILPEEEIKMIIDNNRSRSYFNNDTKTLFSVQYFGYGYLTITGYSYKRENILKLKEMMDNNIKSSGYVNFSNIISLNERNACIEKDLVHKSIQDSIFVSKYKKIIDREISSIENDSICILLHGKPGTGKTSVLKYILKNNDYFKNIKFVEKIGNNIMEYLNSTLYKSGGLVSNNDNDYTLVLFDELDLIINKSKKDTNEESYESTVKTLLTCLDNLPNKTVVVITTNNYDALPEALKRKGRVDLVLEMNDFDEDEYNEYLTLSNVTDKDVEDLLENEYYLEKYAGYSKYNPATLESIVKDIRFLEKEKKLKND